MSRQKKRSTERAIVKSITKKLNPPKPQSNLASGPIVKLYSSLNERQKRGVLLWERAQTKKNMYIVAGDELTVWISQNESNTGHHVSRGTRNQRGTLVVEYRCSCPDFLKNGAIDCKHIFADRLRRGEVIVTGYESTVTPDERQARRRPPRERFAYDGRTIRSSQRSAIRKMPDRLPQLTYSLIRAYDRFGGDIVIPIRPKKYRGGKNPAPISSQAMALISKIVYGASASEMMSEYGRMIDDGILRLRRPPAENTISKWMNDHRLTPVLHEILRHTSLPFREREVGAMIDSSKVSQLMIAHAKEVDYGSDKRPTADWMKCHVLVGVETMVVMSVVFSAAIGDDTHDSKFTEAVVGKGLASFPIEFLLADKAYLNTDIPQWLAERGIRAVIPIKKNHFKDPTATYNKPLTDLIHWYYNENRDFHEIYRLRPKIECLFSLMKRMADGYCWSRGRARDFSDSRATCTAWVNETLCKLIYINLRTTVTLEEETGVKIDYLVPSRRFPAPDEPLLRRNIAA